MNTNGNLKRLLTHLKKTDSVKRVLEVIKNITPNVKWDDVRGKEEEDGLHYIIEGELGPNLQLLCEVHAEIEDEEEGWTMAYRTDVQIFGEGGCIKAGKNGAYTQIMRIDRSLVLMYTTAEKIPEEAMIESVKLGTKHQLPGEEEDIDEAHFFTRRFQQELLGFLARMTLLYIPRKADEETMKELTGMTSGGEVIHYHIKKNDQSNSTGETERV